MYYDRICQSFHKKLLAGRCPWCGSLAAGGQATAVGPLWLREELSRLLPHWQLPQAQAVERQPDKTPSLETTLLAIIENCGCDARTAVPLLHFVLQDLDKTVLVAAANALGRIGPEAKQALPTLFLMLKDEDQLVREAASDAIEQIQRGGA
jgi:hypothetical protein